MKFIITLLLFLSSLSNFGKTALVCGAGGFIGSHLVNRLVAEGYEYVRGIDLKRPEFSPTQAHDFMVADLRDPHVVMHALDPESTPNKKPFDEVYQLAADMGGMGFISFHDAEIMHNSALINLNVLEESRKTQVGKIFFSSSACIYPERNQLDPDNPKCSEDSAYPAAPDTEYGWEKLFSERLYRSYARDYGMSVRIARFHNIFGPEGTWYGGREKAPAALSRKIAEVEDGGIIPIWGKGDQTRSFLYIDECVEGIRRLMDSDVEDILNIGSEERISIDNLALTIAAIAGKTITLTHVPGPEGVRGRNSDNHLIMQKLNWAPHGALVDGLIKTYHWIAEQVEIKKKKMDNV